MKMTYHDHTPAEYEPPLFEPAPDGGVGRFSRKPFSMCAACLCACLPAPPAVLQCLAPCLPSHTLTPYHCTHAPTVVRGAGRWGA